MAHFPRCHSGMRAPRVLISGVKPVKFFLDDKQVAGELQVISSTGGSARFRQALQPGSVAELTISTKAGPVAAVVELLHPRKQVDAVLQGFRFLALSDPDYLRLRDSLQYLRWRSGT